MVTISYSEKMNMSLQLAGVPSSIQIRGEPKPDLLLGRHAIAYLSPMHFSILPPVTLASVHLS